VTSQLPHRYTIIGVDRSTAGDRAITVEAWNEANARAKAELQGLLVTSIQLFPEDSESHSSEPKEIKEHDGALAISKLIPPAADSPAVPFIADPPPQEHWKQVEPSDTSLSEVLLGQVAGQIRQGRLYLANGHWNKPHGFPNKAGIPLGSRLLLESDPNRELLLRGILAGVIPARWLHTFPGIGWRICTSRLWVKLAHPTLSPELHPVPERWNWAALFGGIIWTVATGTWRSLWPLLAGALCLALDAQFVPDDNWLAHGALITAGIVSFLILGGVANGLRYKNRLARGYKVVDYVYGKNRDEALAEIANGTSAARASLAVRPA